jgi:hypothetical protein
MHVNVKKHRATWGMDGGKSRLFACLTHCRVRGVLAEIDVAARLDPDAQLAMAVEEHAGGGDHEGRSGQMRREGMLVEGVFEFWGRLENGGDRVGFSIINRIKILDLAEEILE